MELAIPPVRRDVLTECVALYHLLPILPGSVFRFSMARVAWVAFSAKLSCGREISHRSPISCTSMSKSGLDHFHEKLVFSDLRHLCERHHHGVLAWAVRRP